MFERILEKIVAAPAITLDRTIGASVWVVKKMERRSTIKRARAYWKMLGPGLTTGAADDDPSGVATYSQAGARYGFQLLWLASFTFPLMAVVQEMCARIGLVTGQGLAANIKDHYSKKVLYTCALLLFFANTFNIGADLGAMAKAVQLVMPRTSFVVLIAGFAALSLLLQIFTTYEKYAKYLKWLALILLSYILSAFAAGLDWGAVLHSAFIPSMHFSKEQIILITAVLGTTISPYLFFWQTSQEVEEEILEGKDTLESRAGTTDAEIRKMRIDVWSGMFLSNIVMFFIIAACGAVLFANGTFEIESAAQAAEALRPLAGETAFLLFALGIVGTGLLAVPVLAGSASYALSESFGWPEGLYRKLKEAFAFYGVIIISMVMGLGMNFIGLDPIKALIYSAVANALVSPLVLVLIVQISGSKKIMGERANHPLTSAVGWLIVGFMTLASGATLVALLF